MPRSLKVYRLLRFALAEVSLSVAPSTGCLVRWREDVDTDSYSHICCVRLQLAARRRKLGIHSPGNNYSLDQQGQEPSLLCVLGAIKLGKARVVLNSVIFAFAVKEPFFTPGNLISF